MDDKEEVGGPEFRRRFLVRCRRPDVVAATVTAGVQEVLLRQDGDLKWNRVWIAGPLVLVTVTLRVKPNEWEELIAMTKALLTALP